MPLKSSTTFLFHGWSASPELTVAVSFFAAVVHSILLTSSTPSFCPIPIHSFGGVIFELEPTTIGLTLIILCDSNFGWLHFSSFILPILIWTLAPISPKSFFFIVKALLRFLLLLSLTVLWIMFFILETYESQSLIVRTCQWTF